MLTCAGDADIGQPPLFLQLVRVRQSTLMRKHTVLAAGQEDVVEFQPLGRVQSHQGHHARVRAVRRGRNLVGVGNQSHPLQEGAE